MTDRAGESVPVVEQAGGPAHRKGTPGTPPDGGGGGGRVSAASVRRTLRRAAQTDHLGAIIAVLALIVLFSIAVPDFFTTANFTDTTNSYAVFLILTVGVTFTMLCGGIDLSIAGVDPLAGMILAELLAHHYSMWLSVTIVIVGAVLFGICVNGFLIGVLKVNFFIVTLGSLTALEGLALQLTQGSTLLVSGHAFLTALGNKNLGILPLDGLIGLICLVLGILVLRYTGFGRAIYAVGGNSEAARLAGIRTSLVTCMTYGISAGLAAVGGIIEVGRLGSAGPSTDATIGLTAVAAVLIGGAAFGGGKGTMFGSFIGVLFLSILGSGLLIAGVSTYLTELITGVVLVGAVAADRFRKARK
jgi:ribose transport system permease protein